MDDCEDLSRLKNICRYGHFLMLILTAIFFLGTALMVIGAIWAGVFTDSFPLDDFIVEFEGEGLDLSVAEITAVFGLLALYAGVVGVTFLLVGNIMKAISKEYTPFTEENVRRMRTIAVLYTTMTAMMLVAGIALRTTIGDVVISLTPSVIVVIIVYCISLVFRYGITLQKQSDETL